MVDEETGPDEKVEGYTGVAETYLPRRPQDEEVVQVEDRTDTQGTQLGFDDPEELSGR